MSNAIESSLRRIPELASKTKAALQSHHEDLLAVQIWLATRVAVFFTGYVTSWIFGPFDQPLRAIQSQWNHWDVVWYVDIAESGYEPPNTGFFPLFPWIMRILAPFFGGPVYAGLAVNLVAGLVAAVLIRRLAARWGFDGKWAVVALATAPTTVFLSAPYTESLFLVFAMGAWLSALSGRYWLMALLLALSSLTRVNGFFVIVAVGVLLLTRRAPIRAYAWFAIPALAILGLLTYMRSIRGNWFEWRVTQQESWNRQLVDPITAFNKSWTAAIRPGSDPDFAWFSYNEMFMFRMEILAAAIFAGAVIWLLLWRKWPEAIYVGLNAGVLLTTTNYASLPRYLLVAWPVVILVGWLLHRSTLARWAWAAVIIPLSVLWTANFTFGHWST